MLDALNPANLAHLKYDDGEFYVIKPGTHVVCALTGKPIHLEDLKYWSVARQEAYIDVAASLEAEKKASS